MHQSGFHCIASGFHCSFILPIVPGGVENLTCPNSTDDGVLNIHWQEPSNNVESVIDYVIEVQEIQQSNNRTLLTPPFREEKLSGGTLMTAVTSGVSKLQIQTAQL